MWLLWFEGAAAIYLVAGSIIISAESNIESKIVFKAIPMIIGLPIAFGVFAKLMGWPI